MEPQPFVVSRINENEHYVFDSLITEACYDELVTIQLNQYTARHFFHDHKEWHCRFCGKSSPEVTFKKDAHVIPQCTGNRFIVSSYECDTCNQKFGRLYEDHYAKYFKHFHIMYNVTGSNHKPPKIKEKSPDMTVTHYAEHINDKLSIQFMENDNETAITVHNDHVDWNSIIDTHVPLAVFKSLVKTALTILPENEIANFSETIDWLKEDEYLPFYNIQGKKAYAAKIANIPSKYNLHSVARLYKINKKTQKLNPQLPYLFFQYLYGKMVVQIAVPQKRDGSPYSIEDWPIFPLRTECTKTSATFVNTDHWGIVDFTSSSEAKGLKHSFEVSFESMKQTNATDPIGKKRVGEKDFK